MGSIDARTAEALEDIRRLAREWQMTVAEERLHALLEALPDDVTEHVLPVARDLARQFHKQRRRRIEEHIAARASAPTPRPPTSAAARADLLEQAEGFARELHAGFYDLSARHIFQWATFYREFVNNAFDHAMSMSAAPAEISRVLRAAFATHGTEIFHKGYEYNMQHELASRHVITKALNGLQRFLELPIERYSTETSHLSPNLDASLLRRVCSSMLVGILEGFGAAQLGTHKGWQLLPRYPRSWVHYAGFLTFEDLEFLLAQVEPGELRDGIYDTVLPVVRALDQLAAQQDSAHFMLPGLGQFSWDLRRLEISMILPRGAGIHYVEVQCYTNPSFVSRSMLEEAASRGISAIVAGLRPDLYEWTETREVLRSSVVNTLSEGASFEHQVSRLINLLTSRVLLRQTGVVADAPLLHNFARDFPLHQPELSRYFHVYRTSVRRLLQSFENRNGVRLWCSVRRSGKTTACFDLGATTGTSIVVSQTCDNITHSSDASLFYDSVVDALNAGADLRRDFLLEVLSSCASSVTPASQRIVFVLDEYETLFGRLRASVYESEALRYRVVQPLLNQMVAFGRENLIVFIGQQPDSHYILMDQNQLSPYVRQDAFPLFEYDATSPESEFLTLARKVLTQRVPFDDGFAAAVYSESRGHPWLTVNLLVDFFDWLIEINRSARDLVVTKEDFEEFADVRLRRDHISICPEYAFFRNATSGALADEGRKRSPWLHVVYCCLRELARGFNGSMSCSRAEFRELVRELRVTDQSREFEADHLLSTATSANFLEIKGDQVRPKIRLLARLAAVVAPGVTV